MGEQRDSYQGSGYNSGRSSLDDPRFLEDSENVTSKKTIIGRNNPGLTEQAIKKNTLDKNNTRERKQFGISATDQNLDAES